MPKIPTANAADLRRDLAAAVTSLSTEPDGSFSGAACFGPALIGPPGRLHGGLHAYVRTLQLLDAVLPGTVGPKRLWLDLLKAIHLEQPVPFSGQATGGDDWRLTTRFLDSDRLRAGVARGGTAPEGLLERFAALRAADTGQVSFMAANTVPVRSGSALISMEAERPGLLDHGDPLNRFLTPDGAADAVWMCGALDFLAAVVQGFGWHRHVLTVRIELTLAAERIAGPVLLLGDRKTWPDPRVSLPRVEVNGEMKGPHAVSVLLTEPTLSEAYAWGEITLQPARQRVV